MARVTWSGSARTRAATQPELPERLRRWYVDDWVSDEEQPRPLYLDRNATPEQLFNARALVSRLRFLDARQRWFAELEERGLTRPQLPPPGYPRRRRPRTPGRRTLDATATL